MMVTKTLIDGMEPEAHANAILATDFQEAGTFEDPELTAALKRMSISEDGSWQEADRFTEMSEDTDPGWTKVRQADNATKEARYHGGAGAGSPAADKEGDPRSRSPRTLEAQGHRGGAGLGRGGYTPNQATIAPAKRFTPASSSFQQPKQVKLQRIGATDTYIVTSLPESFPHLNETGKRLTTGMTEKEFGNLFLQFSAGALDTIVVQRILEAYKVQKSKETMMNIMKQPHRRAGDRAGLGAKPLHELKTREDRPPHGLCRLRIGLERQRTQVLGMRQPATHDHPRVRPARRGQQDRDNRGKTMEDDTPRRQHHLGERGRQRPAHG